MDGDVGKRVQNVLRTKLRVLDHVYRQAKEAERLARAEAAERDRAEREGPGLRVEVREHGVVPALVTALAAAGATIYEVTPERSTLESIYLACIREEPG